MADNRSYVYRRLVHELGLTPAQAAGAVGGLGGESGQTLNPNAVNPTSGALGIGQWLGGRARGVRKGDVRQQTDHLISELKGPERAALNQLRRAHTIEDATNVWVRAFERPSPAEIASSMPARLRYARDAFNRLGSASGGALRGMGADAAALVSGGGGGGQAPGYQTKSITVSPAVDNAQARREALAGFLLNSSSQASSSSLPGLDGLPGLGDTTGLPGLPNLTGGGGGTDILGLALQMRALRDQPAVTGTVQVPTGGGGSTSSARAAGVSSGTVGGGGTGAVRALSWVRDKVGAPGSREVAPNQGQLASYLNKRFGFSGAPWCAMFTSAAVTKGGAPLSARTASVAEVRAKAQRGDGYQRGLIDGSHARPGDLILFGNRHIGMVESVEGGRITYVGGNQSDTVSRAQTSAQGATVVRPKYGVRR